jgi:hypothetical protein
MRTAHLPALLLLLASVPPASAADLSKIDRTLKDEPKVQTRSPQYCLLVFGPEAKTRIWLVHDGDVMHVFDSPDGKATKKWRQVKGSHGFYSLGDVWEVDGKTRHRNLHVRIGERPYVWLNVEGMGRMRAGWDRNGKLAFASSAKEAPVIHFNGPVTMDLFREQEPFRSGAHECLNVVVGMRGVGPGTFATIDCSAYPKNGWPTAVIEFPAKKEGDKPIAVPVTLSDD